MLRGPKAGETTRIVIEPGTTLAESNDFTGQELMVQPQTHKFEAHPLHQEDFATSHPAQKQR